jgi:hypothetical protein
MVETEAVTEITLRVYPFRRRRRRPTTPHQSLGTSPLRLTEVHRPLCARVPHPLPTHNQALARGAAAALALLPPSARQRLRALLAGPGRPALLAAVLDGHHSSSGACVRSASAAYLSSPALRTLVRACASSHQPSMYHPTPFTPPRVCLGDGTQDWSALDHSMLTRWDPYSRVRGAPNLRGAVCQLSGAFPQCARARRQPLRARARGGGGRRPWMCGCARATLHARTSAHAREEAREAQMW